MRTPIDRSRGLALVRRGHAEVPPGICPPRGFALLRMRWIGALITANHFDSAGGVESTVDRSNGKAPEYFFLTAPGLQTSVESTA